MYDETLKKKLKIGVWIGLDEYCGFCPSITRALTETADKLRKDGHEIVEFKPHWSKELMETYYSMIIQSLFGGLAKTLRERGD
jgi:Asp-tRNA(Asn)/Glu-tRNA(Gln) amidotransferase A subunit family amidase